MITLTVYEDEDGRDRYQVVRRETLDAEAQDVTDLYIIAACEDQDGNKGFAVFPKKLEGVVDGE